MTKKETAMFARVKDGVVNNLVIALESKDDVLIAKEQYLLSFVMRLNREFDKLNNEVAD